MTRKPELAGQTVVVIGGSAGIGLETARRAREEGAEVILTGRNAEHLKQATADVGAREVAAFDATDPAALGQFFAGLPGPVDHVMVTGPGPYYAPLADLDHERAIRDFDGHLWLAIEVARYAVGRVRPGGTLLFMSGTSARGPGLSLMAAFDAALPALIANLAVEVAPVRVNLIAAGFVDTALSARLLGDDLDARRAQLSARLPIGRVVGPADIALLAVHLMINTASPGRPTTSTAGSNSCRTHERHHRKWKEPLAPGGAWQQRPVQADRLPASQPLRRYSHQARLRPHRRRGAPRNVPGWPGTQGQGPKVTSARTKAA